MPDTPVAALVPDMPARRRDAMRDAVASARIEGMRVSDDARAIMELYTQGHITETEMVEQVSQLHGRR